MYKVVKRDRSIKETLVICHEDGTEALTLDVDINTTSIVSQMAIAREVLAAASGTLQKDPSDVKAMTALGTAVITMLTIIFGAENAKKLVEFYDSAYDALLVDIYPFIDSEIMPKIREASAERKAELLAAVNRK
jgi:hypothetical protein